MATTYRISLEQGDLLRVGFGDPAQNDQIVKDALARLDEMISSGELAGGEVMRVNGPASLPVAMVLAHRLAHLYQALAYFDPNTGRIAAATAVSRCEAATRGCDQNRAPTPTPSITGFNSASPALAPFNLTSESPWK